MVDLIKTNGLKNRVNGLVEKKKALSLPSYGNLKPSLFAGQRRVPWATSGPVGRTPTYSMRRAVARLHRLIEDSDCKEEVEVNKQLRTMYGQSGLVGNHTEPSFSVLASANPLYHPSSITDDSNNRQKLAEYGKMLNAGVEGFDPDEIRHYEKALGTYPATSGGTFVPPPNLLGDYIDFQRSWEVFAGAGATEMAFSPQGRTLIPRQTGDSTSYWVGEGATITESQPVTGDLELTAKKLATRVKISIEGQNFSNPSLEAMTRRSMSQQSARAVDLAFIEGTGGTQPRGILGYEGNSNAYLNYVSVVASTTSAVGDTFEPQDVLRMLAATPDVIRRTDLRWAGNPNLFAHIANKRADAVTASDGKGLFMFNVTRRVDEKIPDQLDGIPFVVSRQMRANRVDGSVTSLYALILGHFPDWVIARYGVLDLLLNPFGDTDYSTGMVSLRSIQFIDGGATTPNSFVVCDDLLVP